MSRVSVLLPVYNAGATLRPAVESVLAQTEPPLEVLLVDDASTDGSAEEVDRLAASDPRVRAIHHATNHGLAASLNEGLETARGEFVARMDQDDLALPHRFARQAAFLAARPEVAVVGSWVYNLGATPAHDRLVRLPYTPEQIRETLPRSNCLYHPATMLRRSVVLAAGGYRREFKNAEDYELWLRLSRTHALANLPEPLLRYRLSTGGMTIGRKWEQLRYVLLAQESHGSPGLPWPELEARAAARLAAQDRQAYFDHVVEDACRRLAQLGFAAEAAGLAARMAPEMSPGAAGRLRRALGPQGSAR